MKLSLINWLWQYASAGFQKPKPAITHRPRGVCPCGKTVSLRHDGLPMRHRCIGTRFDATAEPVASMRELEGARCVAHDSDDHVMDGRAAIAEYEREKGRG